MDCSRCGTPANSSDRVCRTCGAPLALGDPLTAAQEQPPVTALAPAPPASEPAPSAVLAAIAPIASVPSVPPVPPVSATPEQSGPPRATPGAYASTYPYAAYPYAPTPTPYGYQYGYQYPAYYGYYYPYTYAPARPPRPEGETYRQVLGWVVTIGSVLSVAIALLLVLGVAVIGGRDTSAGLTLISAGAGFAIAA